MQRKNPRSVSALEPKFERTITGELRLMRTEAAASYIPITKPLVDGPTSMKNAKERASVLGGLGAARSTRYVLSQLVVQFGKYKGQTFKWLLENDLGWVTGVMGSVMSEDNDPETDHPISYNKHRLLQYLKFFPEAFTIAKEKEVVARRKRTEKEKVPATATRPTEPAPTTTQPPVEAVDAGCMEDKDLVEAVRDIEAMEVLSNHVVYSAWKQVLDHFDQKWISRTLFRVNKQGKPEMSFDTIDRMWYHPPTPPLVCTQPPVIDRYFSRPICLWMPKKLWRVKLSCPEANCKGQEMISSGIYRTLRKVLTMSSYYYLASEYLECPKCHKKLSSWSEELLNQLDVGHRLQFPCILTRLMACDMEVVKMMRQRGLGNSVARLRENLAELHGEEMLRRTARYLSDCQTFTNAQKRGLLSDIKFPPPPTPPKVPSCHWLLSIYCQDVLTRLEEVKAAITSVFGRIIKVDSTKKVVRKLQGTAAETAAWATNVGNEHGQVLISVLTAGEGAGLDSMFQGLQNRYRDSGVPPPEVIYVDRDCCGPNFIGKKFDQWSATQVRLDIWHYMRRIASACTTESHALYPQFMKRLSGCIFQWSEEDLSALKEAKESQARKEGVTIRGKESDWISKKELARHCRRVTRSPSMIQQLVEELLEVYAGEQGRDLVGTPLIDQDKARDMWESQKRHVECVQDPPNVSLYTQTGTLKKGDKTLNTYRCARGSTSLESFHLHLNRFIPGTSANDVHYQAYLLEGLYRWNQDRAFQAVEVEAPLCHTYSGLLRHAVNHLAQTVLGTPLDPAFQPPRVHTGEMIGIEYLYSQTGKALQDVKEEEETEAEEEEDVDEGFDEEEALEDMTIPDIDISVGTESAKPVPRRSRSPARARAEGRTTQATSLPASEPVPQETGDQRPTTPPTHQETEMEETDSELPEVTTGRQEVEDLADCLVQFRNCRTLTKAQEDRVIALWERLQPQDQRPTVFQPRTKSPPKGRFMAAKTAKQTPKANQEKTKRSFVGSASGPATFPDSNRYMEAVVRRLMELYPSPQKRPNTPTISRWSLVLTSYNRIRDVVLDNARVMCMTAIQLLAINNTTLMLWDKRKQKKREEQVLSQGIEVSNPPVTAPQPVLPALTKPQSLMTQTAPAYQYKLPPNTAGQSTVRIRTPPPHSPPRFPSPPRLPPSPTKARESLKIIPQPIRTQYVFVMPDGSMTHRKELTVPPVPSRETIQPTPQLTPQQMTQLYPSIGESPKVSRSTASYRRKVQKKKEAGQNIRDYKPRKGPAKCRMCGEPKNPDTHKQYYGNWFCSATAEESYDQWCEKMKEKKYTSRKRPAEDSDSPSE